MTDTRALDLRKILHKGLTSIVYVLRFRKVRKNRGTGMTEASENQAKLPELLDSEAIGKQFNLSEHTIDVLLETYGFQQQVKVPGHYGYCYAPTQSKGASHCDTLKVLGYSGDLQPFYRPLWRQTIIESFRGYL